MIVGAAVRDNERVDDGDGIAVLDRVACRSSDMDPVRLCVPLGTSDHVTSAASEIDGDGVTETAGDAEAVAPAAREKEAERVLVNDR